jgi:hypothetical protein
MGRDINTIKEFAQKVYDILKSNRDVVTGTAGMTGEGKSVFATQFTKAYCEVAKIPFSFDMMTWERKEMMRWIDGEGESKEGQKPEYSAIIPDELIGMFYGRSWYEDAQKESIKTFNSCRDRHLFVVGNVPNFWELDGGFRSRVRFYVFIPERGKAWVFQQENNPFTKDVWNVTENCKLFRKKGNPYSSKNFLCEIHYDDMTPDEAVLYSDIRNTKRIHMNDESKEKQERYTTVRRQRDLAIKGLIVANPELTQREIADMLGVSEGLISMIKNGFV